MCAFFSLSSRLCPEPPRNAFPDASDDPGPDTAEAARRLFMAALVVTVAVRAALALGRAVHASHVDMLSDMRHDSGA